MYKVLTFTFLLFFISCGGKTSKSSTGIIGIHNAGGRWKSYYIGVRGGRYDKGFSIKKYGACEAFTMACNFRYKNCGKLKVYRGRKFPCDIPVPFEYVD